MRISKLCITYLFIDARKLVALCVAFIPKVTL